MSLDIKKIIQEPLPEDQYVKAAQTKNQCVLHHTVSGAGYEGDINSWLTTKERIATAFIITREGKIVQCFSSKYWASSLGIKAELLKAKGFKDYGTRGLKLEKANIGIELDSWGGLTVKNGKYYSAFGKEVPVENVIVYPKPYRGFTAFEKYTEAQLAAAKDLLEYLCKTYSIPVAYNPDMFEVSSNALAGKAGIWSHTSYRADKNDVHPQPELIEMLKNLKLL